MVLLIFCFLFLTACAPTRHTPVRKVYYDLGLTSADHITVLAQAGPSASERFAVFFRAFSTEFETQWPRYGPGPACLASQWHITLREAGRDCVMITLIEDGGMPQAFLWHRFTREDFGGVRRFAQRTVRSVIELLAYRTTANNEERETFDNARVYRPHA